MMFNKCCVMVFTPHRLNEKFLDPEDYYLIVVNEFTEKFKI